MTFEDYAGARHLLAEEQVGVSRRAHQRAVKQQIDQTKAAMRKHGVEPVKLMPRVVAPPILEKGKQTRGKVA